MAIPVIILVSVVTFSLIHIAPGDPVQMLLGIYGDPGLVEVLQKQLNLDKPVAVQYFLWVKNLMHGDLWSFLPVKNTRIRYDNGKDSKDPFIVNFGTWIISDIFSYRRSNSCCAAKFSGRHRHDDICNNRYFYPEFWMAILLDTVFFSVYLKILPVMGYIPFLQDPLGSIKHLVLPALALGVAQASITARMTRSEMLEVLGQDYIKTARAKGH